MPAPRSLCIIPARGGSKRIPRKNIRPFRGRPMLEWSVRAALESGVFARVMVSTDDAEIAATARAAGAEVPFLRSAANSDDHATTSAVLVEVLTRYAEAGESFDTACCLYPTAPFVTGADLAEGLALLTGSGFSAVFPVVAYSYPIWRSFARDPGGRLRLNFPENRSARSQDLPPAYHDAGQWYWFHTARLLAEGEVLGPDTGSTVIDALRAQDIDTEDDWQLAEIKHQRLFG